LLAELPAVTPVGGEFTSAFPTVSADGERAAIAQGSSVRVYNLPSGDLRGTLETPAAVTTVAFAGHDVASGSLDGSVLISREDGALLRLPTAGAGIDTVAFTPQGGILAADAQRRLRFFDQGGGLRAEIELPYRVMSIRVAGARAIALQIDTGSAAPPVLIDLERARVICQLQGHVGWVFSARWLTDGRILTAGGDGTARVWDGITGTLQQTYQDGRLLSDAIALDGLVVAGGIDGALRFWDQATGRRLWTLPAHRSQVVGIHVEGHDLVTRGIAGDVARWAIPPAEQVIRACDAHEPCDIVRR
jgi:WD40 repeat protein